MEDNTALNTVNACDRIAFLICLRIASADEHDADGSTRVELNLALIQIAFSYALKQVDDVAFQTKHDALRLRVAHATVILNDVGFCLTSRRVCTVDESEEDEAFIVDTILGETFNGRTDDAVLDLLHPILRGKGYGRNRAHATCI